MPILKEALPLTQILMVTASNDRITIQKAILSGAANIIVKPFSIRTVQDAVLKAVATLARPPARS